MKAPKFPTNEAERLKAVKSYNILDSLPEKDYDNLTELAAMICDVPIALITVLDKDRNFFKSLYGINFTESPRDTSFCGHAILENDIFIINDAREDIRFIDNPLLEEQNLVFYAGVPLLNQSGYNLGTICIFDHQPRQLHDTQIQALKTLGQQAVNLLELRKKNANLNLIKQELEMRNKQLNSFASVVSHDLKSPLSNIISLTNLLKIENKNELSDEAFQYLNYIEDSTTVLKDYIDGILKYYTADELLKSTKEDILLSDIAENIKHILISKNDQLLFNDTVIKDINKAALSQILINLVDNALKYNDKTERIIQINYQSSATHHEFSVKDNGIGIPVSQQDEVFDIFKTADNNFVKSTTGIGLSTVKNLVEKLNGHISVVSELGKGSTFSFTIE
ncbi:sensor histidine kinase [Winogradskyella sp. PC D3.3]